MEKANEVSEVEQNQGLRTLEEAQEAQLYNDPHEIFARLIDNMRKYHPSDDFSMVEKAYHFAAEAHKVQKRKSGEPYIIHPLEVAIILSELELDRETIAAGILHDVIEDTLYTYEDIKREFSEEVAQLVDGVTKLAKIEYSSVEEEQANNYRKMFLAMSNDIRVIIIKIADRLHNLRTLEYMTPSKQKQKARETIDIYAPLAERLGITMLRYELEDLAFKYENPEHYFDLKQKIQRKQSERYTDVKLLVDELKEHFRAAGMYECNYSENIKDLDIKESILEDVEEIKKSIKRKLSVSRKSEPFKSKMRRELEKPDIKGFFIEGRPKHFFSIHKKMVRQDKTLEEIYDLFAVRVIVSSIKDCYEVLGMVHAVFTPIPGRFKDYIAMPKPNRYRSIHTTLIGPGGQPFEIQIRTWEMHRVCEYGVAAHWKYKEGSSNEASGEESSEKKLTWLRQMMEWQRDLSDNREYLDALKGDLDVYRDQVYCFTPKGDVKTMVAGATPIDFAYAIHTAVGNHMTGAKVNGRIVQIDYTLENGDRVDIMTNKNAEPGRDWVRIAKSSQARSKITQFLKQKNKEKNTGIGKSLLEKEAKRKNLTLGELATPEAIKLACTRLGMADWDSMCAAIGYGSIRETQVINRLYEEYLINKRKEDTGKSIDEIRQELEQQNTKPRSTKNSITINGIGDTSVRFSKCCNPVLGDEIVAFTTRGRGISLHRKDCVNMQNLSEEDKERLLPATWALKEDGKTSYRAELNILGDKRNTFLMDICRVLSDENIQLLQVSAREQDGTDHINITIMVRGKEQLEFIQKKLRAIKGMHSITRVST